MENEVWLPVVGYEDYYEVRNLGRIKSHNRKVNCKNNSTSIRFGKILKPQVDRKWGGLNVILCNPFGQKRSKIHRLVAIAFIPNPQNKPEVNHIDGDRFNNCVSNLEWVTSSENKQHAYDTGLKIPVKGEDHCRAKLNPELISLAIAMRANGSKLKEISELVGVSSCTLSKAINGKSWKHLRQ
jgi:hypothetical protein